MTESCVADGELVEQVLDLQMSIVCWGAGGGGERELIIRTIFTIRSREELPARNCACSKLL